MDRVSRHELRDLGPGTWDDNDRPCDGEQGYHVALASWDTGLVLRVSLKNLSAANMSWFRQALVSFTVVTSSLVFIFFIHY